MKRLNVDLGTEENIGTALETLGFERDETNVGRYYWGDNHYDKAPYLTINTGNSYTVLNLYCPNDTNAKGYLHKSNNSGIENTNLSFMYEYLDGGGIALGIDVESSTNPRIELIIKKVKDKDDNDRFVIISYPNTITGSNTVYYTTINMYSNDRRGGWSSSIIYLGCNYRYDADSLQYTKIYDKFANDFYDGVYIVQISPNIPCVLSTSANNSNVKSVIIDGKTYLIVNMVYTTSSTGQSSSLYFQKIMVPVAQSSE